MFKLKAQPEPYSTQNLRFGFQSRLKTARQYLTSLWTLLDGRDGVHGYLNYNAELFKAETVRRMASHFRTLLEGIAANPEARISELPLLTRSEREQLIVEWNNTGHTFPTNVCLHQLIETQVERTPDAIALVSENESLTYGELNRRANRLAYRLRQLGVTTEVIVGIFAECSIEDGSRPGCYVESWGAPIFRLISITLVGVWPLCLRKQSRPLCSRNGIGSPRYTAI